MRFTNSTDVGFTYGTHDSDEYGAFLTAYQIPPTPATRDNELQIPGRIGTYDSGTEWSRLDITLQVGLWVPNGSRAAINDAVRRLMALMDPRDGYQPLTFDEDSNFYLNAKLTASSGTSQITVHPKGPNGEMAAQVDIAMKCKDPHWYSHSQGERTVVVPTGGGAVNVVNPGLAPSPVLITLTGTANSISGTQKGVIVGGVEVGYDGVLLNGETVIINTDPDFWTLTKGGVNHIGDWYGEMPTIPGGNSALATVGQCSATVKYTPRWIA